MTALISTSELAPLLGSPSLVVVNGSWHMPSEGRNAKQEHTEKHIPGAVFFDIDAISDTSSPYPHMLPTEEQFAQAVSALGIDNQSQVVVYDSTGLFSAARVWWMFRVFGHDNVKVLDGGLPKWLAEDHPTESGESSPSPAFFTPHYRPELVRSFEDIQHNCTAKREQVVDARSAGRFSGAEPEPRAGLRSGSIEGSFNIPFRECTTPPFHTLKPIAELRPLFTGRGIALDKPIITSCGSGVTACVLALALFELGAINVPVYDGAWAEWASRTEA